MVNIPPAPIPQTALAAIKLPMLPARAHHAVAIEKTKHEKTKGIFRPIVSDTRPYRGWNEVAVSMKEVESHDAALDELKAEVMDVWVEAMIVVSAAAT